MVPASTTTALSQLLPLARAERLFLLARPRDVTFERANQRAERDPLGQWASLPGKL